MVQSCSQLDSKLDTVSSCAPMPLCPCAAPLCLAASFSGRCRALQTEDRQGTAIRAAPASAPICDTVAAYPLRVMLSTLTPIDGWQPGRKQRQDSCSPLLCSVLPECLGRCAKIPAVRYTHPGDSRRTATAINHSCRDTCTAPGGSRRTPFAARRSPVGAATSTGCCSAPIAS